MDDLTREFLAESNEGLDRMERCLTELEANPECRDLVSEIFRAVHTIKGSTGFLGFGRLEALAHAGENLLGSVRSGRLKVTRELTDGLLSLLDGLRSVLRLIEVTGGEGQRSGDDDYALIGQMIELNAVPQGDPSADRIVRAADPGCQDTSAQTAGAEQQRERADAAERRLVSQGTEKTLRIAVETMNLLMSLVGELVLTRNQILQNGPSAENFTEMARRLDTVTSDLRSAVMHARMQPLGHLFGKFPRLIRDLAQVCGRQVRMEFQGQATGLDKSLLEAVRDPLTHAVRNAVDHGIEPPEERIAAGKHPEGVIRLRAFHQNGSVVIEVSDDGAGIAPERVLAKAVERQLVTPEEALQMTPRQVMQLIFAAGFSTSDVVTNISGRGVGMDVIRDSVEKVGGSVEIESQVGIGTSVRLRIPLTIAIVPALVVRTAGRCFAIPQRMLEQLVYLGSEDVPHSIERLGGAEFCRLRGSLLPMVRLDRLLGLTAAETGPSRGAYMAVLDSDGWRYGLVIDQVLSPEEVVVKRISSVLRESGAFIGMALLGSGEMGMILDVPGIATRSGVPLKEVSTRVAWPPGRDDTPRCAGQQEVVVFELVRRGSGQISGDVETVALPLQTVERIETVQRESIEFANGSAVLRYRGELLPLEDEGGILQRRFNGEITVLICHAPRRSGVLVERVLDVCTAAMPHHSTGNRLALVNDRLTLMRNGATDERLEEVA